MQGQDELQGAEIVNVGEFKYQGSAIKSNGRCRRVVKRRVQTGLSGWKRVSGVICDRSIAARVKGNICNMVVRPAMM